jgi:hypothetical protein
MVLVLLHDIEARTGTEITELDAAASWECVVVWKHDDAVAAADRVEGVVRSRRGDI